MTDRKPTYEELEQRVRELEIAESEREQAQEALRSLKEQLSFYRRAVDSLEDYKIAVVGKDYRYGIVSSQYLRDYNLTEAEIVGKTVAEIMGAEVFEQAVKPHLDRALDGQVVRYADWFVYSNHEPRYMEVSYYPVVDEDRKVTSIVALSHDVTSRKQIEHNLRQSEEKWRNILAETPQIGITLDTQAAIVFANRRFLELTGWQEEEVLGRNWFDLFIPEEIRDEIRGVFDTVMKARDTLAYTTYENEILTRTGERLNVAWSNVLTKDPAGAVIDVTCLGIDLTERKRAEEALLESEQKYRNLVENSSEAIFVAQDGKLVFTNQTCTLLTGYATEELLTRPFIEFIHPDDRKMVVDRHVKRINGEEIPQRYPFRTLHKDGSIRWNELNVVLINWNGTPATLNFLSDITEHKKLESQLNQSQKMEAIGTLAGGIAHNFNNILMGIQGRASLMMMDKDPSHPDHQHLNEITQYVRRAADLTRDLLGFARGGKYEIKTTDLNSLIKQENRMFGSTTREILLHEKYEKDLWAVEVDQGQIRQALLNLYVNAWQAMPAGGDLYVQTENVTLDEGYIKPFEITPGRYVKISVTDTGPGMSAAIRQKIFDPFFSTKGQDQGSGLGLASVYGIIKNHGGFINVYSEEGEGTTFNIYLPASAREVVEESPGPMRHDLHYGQGTILLVDDEEMIIEVGRKGLERLGYRVLVASGGQEALDIYGRQKDEIDLVMLDMIMPGQGGGETYDRLKAMNDKVRVLLSSGYSLNGQAREILERGCRGFIQKPFTLVDLSRKVAELLKP